MSKVTMIKDLPSLEDLEFTDEKQNTNPNNFTGSTFLTQEQASKVSKFIRGEHKIPPEAGMKTNGQYHKDGFHNFDNRHTAHSERSEHGDHDYRNMNMHPHIPGHFNEFIPTTEFNTNEFNRYISCVDFNNHVRSCPICSKFYNTDKTLYIITIIVLSIFCLLLLKKQLNM